MLSYIRFILSLKKNLSITIVTKLSPLVCTFLQIHHENNKVHMAENNPLSIHLHNQITIIISRLLASHIPITIISFQFRPNQIQTVIISL